MTSMYTSQFESSTTSILSEVSEMVSGVSGLLGGIAERYTGPEAAAIKMVGTQLDVYRQSLDLVVTHIATPDFLIKDLFMPAKVRRNILFEFRNVLDSANVGDLLESFVTTSIDSAAAALRSIVEIGQDDAALYEALHWLEVANEMLWEAASTTYGTWNNQKAA